MRPPSPPSARWLCVLVGALACALGPAVSVRRAAQSPGSWGWSEGDGSPAVCSSLCGGDKGRGAPCLASLAPQTGSRPEGWVGSPSSLVPSRAVWSPLGAGIWDTGGGEAGKSRLQTCLPCSTCGLGRSVDAGSGRSVDAGSGIVVH